MTWRQHRGAALVGTVVVAVVGAALLALGVTARSNSRRYGLTACLRGGTDCTSAIEQLQRHYHWLPPAAASLFVLPLLAGIFWGAPLVAREIETGTFRLAWTQSISRLRWICTKLVLVLGAAAVAMVALSFVAVWAFRPLIPVLGNRFRGGWFDAQGVVPAAYTVFALALGICLGAIWRRTLPAMATTIAVFAVVRIAVHSIRRDLIPAQTKKVAAGAISQLAHTPWPPGFRPGDWILYQTPTGTPTSGPPTNGPPSSIYHYIAAGQFWRLQSIEAAMFLALTAALVGLCLVVVTRAHPH